MTVSSFTGDTSRSTYSGDLLCTVRTENGQLLPLSDTSSALVVPNAKRPLWSVRHAQLAGHEIVLDTKPGLLLQGNPSYFVPFVNCPETGLWLIRLLPPPTLHNRIYPIHLSTNSLAHDTRLQDHERLGNISVRTDSVTGAKYFASSLRATLDQSILIYELQKSLHLRLQTF